MPRDLTERGPEGTCPLETAYGGPGPIRYCPNPSYTGPLPIIVGSGKDLRGWCAEHLVEWGYLDPKNREALEQYAARDAGLGVGHIWTNTRCPAYTTYDPDDCTCKENA